MGSNPAGPTSEFVTALTCLIWILKIVCWSRNSSLGIRLILLLLGGLLFVGLNASAQQADATPTPTATPQSEQSTGQESPAASPSPEPQQEPQLLPNTNALPAQPSPTPALRDLLPQGINTVIPGSLLPTPNSAEQSEKDKFRFREIRSIAVRNPYAVYLLRKAQSEHNDEAKREYLRVYYMTMCDEMRKLEPRLKGMIDGFENTNVGRSSPLGQRPTIPGRDLPRYKAIELEGPQH